VREILASKQITVLEHPPYSPDLAPSDFLLFPKMKEILKGRHFDDIDDIRSTLKATTVIFSNEVYSTFTTMSSRTLLSDHVCL
jgi:transposase